MIVDIYNTSDFGAFMKHVDQVAEGGFTIGLFSGAWDLLHYYHIKHLQMAKRLCYFLIVGVGTDRLVRHNKGKDRPIYPEDQRLGMINSIKYVDACFLMDDEDGFGRVAGTVVRPHNGIIFKNEDWLDKLDKIPSYDPDAKIVDKYGKDFSESLHGNVVIIPDIDNTNSTTGFIKKIRGLET